MIGCRISLVRGVLYTPLFVALLCSCGDDSSSGFDAETEAYCRVKHTSSTAELNMLAPDEIKAKIKVDYDGEKVYATLTETFYKNYKLDVDSICDNAAERDYDYEPGSFSCDKTGLTYTLVSDAKGASNVMDAILEDLNEQCEKFNKYQNMKGYPAFGAKSSSSGKSSSGMSSSSAKSSSSVKISSSKFTDSRDGNVYRVVQVGAQVWMLDNLAFVGNKDYPLAGETFCKDDCDGLQGVLYTYTAAMNNDKCANQRCNSRDSLVQGACPEGWALPTTREWNYLKEHLKDTSAFFANPTGEWGRDWKDDDISRFWTSTEANADGAYEFYYNYVISNQPYSKSMGYGVRCVLLESVIESATVKSSSSVASSSSVTASSSSEISSSSYSSSSMRSSSSVESSSSMMPSSSSEEMYSVEGIKDLPVTKIIENGDNNAVTDKRDGKAYRVVQIGDHVWMLDNLGFVGNEEYPLAVEAFCKNGCDSLQGALYSYAAAMNDAVCADHICNPNDLIVQGACPEGWGLPRGRDWSNLKNTIEGVSAFFPNPTGEWMGFWSYDAISRFWTSTEQNAKGAYEYYYRYQSIESQTYAKSSGYGVRCVALKDVTPDTVVGKGSSVESSTSVESSSSFMEPVSSPATP